MDGDRHLLTPQKRPNESADVGGFKRRTPDSVGVHRQDVSGLRRVYKLKILLPNGMTVLVKIPEGTERITVEELSGRVRNEHDKAVQKASNPKKQVNWNAQLCFVDDSDKFFRKSLLLTKLEPNRVYNLRLHDGSDQPAKIYENMWDLTPDTELLKELPEEYTFETALADIIDNSLQAVWSNGEQERRLISVEVSDDRISIIDTGPGMDSSSIEKWGKMGASLHRASKGQAIGGKPPYLKPAFGMFGYGGLVASMHLGRYTEVSSKTKNSKKVYMLRLEREALVNGSGSKRTWRTYGSLRDPMKDELQLAPDGSFTKVDIFEPKKNGIDIRQLKCKLKDIYFPYIQCDELSKKGRTTMPIEFQVNGTDLAEISGGEVAITNLNTCNGPEFVLQLRFHLNHDNATTTSSPGARSFEEANARLKCFYLPVKEGKESIQNILETLKDGYGYAEDFGSFSHVSCRRLGRLLPDARWAWLPFMDFRQRPRDKSQVLKRSCMRVKCFIETDAGFNPTPSKTDFAHQNPFTTALRNLGSKQPLEKEMGVHIDIRRDGKSLNLSQLDKQYQQWLVQMHEKYDEEVDCGIDEPVFIVNFTNKELHIENNVVRVHKAVMRKGKSWNSGQKIKILKGACAGFHKTNIYATLDYIILEGLQGDAGEAWIICRRIDVSKENGCLLESANGNPILDLRKSELVPINVIDSEKCLAVDDSEWDDQLRKQYQKCPSSIQILNRRQCLKLGIDSTLPDKVKIYASHVSPRDIVAVIRPATFKSGIDCEDLDQKYVMKDNFEMSLSVTYSENGNETNIYSGRVTPSSRKDLHGLYIFQPKCDSHPLFQKAGVYTFTFSIRDSSCEKCVVKVKVEASREVHKWALAKKLPDHDVTVGRCFQPVPVAMFDQYSNQIPFSEVPEVLVQVKCTKGVNFKVHKWSPSTSPDKLSFILKNLIIESSNLDNIRPNYDATLLLCWTDGSHMLDIPVKVFPGSLKSVTVQPENFEKQLIPGHIVKELTLELFDGYRNHVREKVKVQLSVDGFGALEKSFSVKKVDAHGCIDLGGLLKVTAGYGRKVSLSVTSDGQPVITKEWQIEERQLRIASLIPETCFAGSYLEQLEFEIVDSKGHVDVNFHDEDKIGQSHTLVIKSHNIDESVKYIFREGRCVVRAVPVPSEIGEFSFIAAHACHPELQVTIKVHVELHPVIEPLNVKLPSQDENIFPLMDSNTPMDTPTGSTSVQHHIPDNYADGNGIETELESILDFQRDFENDIIGYGSRIGEHEENIRLLEYQQRGIESQLLELDVSKYQTSTHKYSSPGKDEITAKIECKNDSAAAVVIKLLKMTSALPDEDCSGLMGRIIIGVVALLGTAPTPKLSRILAEYLGDQMLAVVCKSYQYLQLLELYEENGKVDRAHALHMFASEHGQSINGRFGVLYIDDIRACEVPKDFEGKLLLPDPTLPNGTTPKGFSGYAVNMIDIDPDYIHTRTDSGYGLRETLFYRLFGETQVYETRDDMIRAISSIKDGAVSLDGGILRGNGAMSLGCWEPDIIFPVAATRNEAATPNAKHIKNRYNQLTLKLKKTVEDLVTENNCLESVKKKFKKKHAIYTKYFTRNQPIASSSNVSPVSCLDQKPVVVVGSYTPSPSYKYGTNASQKHM